MEIHRIPLDNARNPSGSKEALEMMIDAVNQNTLYENNCRNNELFRMSLIWMRSANKEHSGLYKVLCSLLRSFGCSTMNKPWVVM